ncbi:transketolase family protein [Clostridium magnum]|uniref:1-deoxy-D-xylulose-5-phosphate synthase n=1 Tax=Clostridium magnum DSM 2767 TaxID=1121326 RepID=A0A162SB31_9CLOT|nr:transketolase family protein [Clostridium magnum]KZL91004.1 1-deoxy-D-xylulose-5-phosphate synthase [Clostridium magnum DSM 2767]SHI65956.1 transketolase [Clostridium magnum DSM 2767]
MSEIIATREAYGKALAELGNKYEFFVFDADLAEATKTGIFKKAFPERFFDAGIAESNMISTAAGMAACGDVVFASSFAMFAAGRAFEQVRNSVCYPNLNVKICATHAGLSVGEDGATHQCLEDIGIMRTIPNITILSPVDAVETKAAIEVAIQTDGPFYVRLGRMGVPVINDESTYKFELGKGVTLREGKDVTIISTGIMVFEALKAAETLEKENISARVINLHTLKPVDKDIIIKAAQETGAIVTVDEHNVMGGLGSIVAEVVVEKYPVPMRIVGVNDTFGQSGKPAQLFEKYNLTSNDVVNSVKQVLEIKK